MDSKTVELLDKKTSEIRVELSKGVNKEKLDLMLYNLQISVYKLEKE